MIQSPLLSKIPNLHHAFGTRLDSFEDVITCKQVHGTYLYFLSEGRKIERPGYDILMTDKPGTAIGVKTADCLPILAIEPEQGLIAAAHAGWRGTAAKISQELCEQFERRGGRIQNLLVALGPSIGGSCYEVRNDVVHSFEKEFEKTDPFLKRRSETHWLLDLREANRLELIRLGVSPENIEANDLCTHCRPDLFHSFRREGEKVGRMINFIELLPYGSN